MERFRDPTVTGQQNWQATFARAGADAMQTYEEVLVPTLFGPWGTALLDELGVRPGESVLDVACGPGTVARLAAVRTGPRGTVTGCDISGAMLAIAGAKPPPDDAAPITYLECPAQALVVADESFDVATCQHGLQFFGDRVAALAEIHRALRPGGRLGVAVWADIGRQPPFDAVHQAIRVVLGDDTADRYRDGAWALGDPDLLVATAREAGFTEARVQERTLPLVLEGGIDRLLTTVAATGVAGDIAALDPDRAAALRAATAEAAGALVVEGTIRSSATALWLFATR